MADKKTTEPLTGDAAWRAHKKDITDRNDAAQKKGRAEREARDAVVREQRMAAERRERANLPTQPRPQA